MALIGIVCSVYSVHHIRRNINESANNRYTLGIQHVTSILDIFPGEGSIFDTSFLFSQAIRKTVNADSLNYNEHIYMRSLTSVINNYVNIYDTVDSIYLYMENTGENYIRSGHGLSSLKDSIHREWLDLLRDGNTTQKVWLKRYVSRYYTFEQPRDIVSMFYRLENIGGAIVINMNNDGLSKMLNTLVSHRDEMVFVTDLEGNYLFGNDASLFLASEPMDIDTRITLNRPYEVRNLYNVKLDGEQYIMLQSEDNHLGIRFYSLTPYDVIYELPAQMFQFMLFAAAIAAIVSLTVAYIITKKDFERLQNVVSVINAAENGKYEHRHPKPQLNEYDLILNNVIDVFIRNSYLDLKVKELELEKQVAEYQTLQMQINPHFLFNTLQGIYMKARLLDASGAMGDAVQNLSDILRYSLELAQPLVTVREEIAISKKYLSIQTERYPRRFYTIWDYDDSVLDCAILRLSLQPILENCLQHGVLQSEKPGIIKVRFEKTRRFLHVTITDNGIGMSAQDVRNLLCSVHDGAFNTSEHIGLKNVYKRIKLSFGNDAGLNITGKIGVGTCVSYSFPIDTILCTASHIKRRTYGTQGIDDSGQSQHHKSVQECIHKRTME